jgi:hypothetical protein
MEALARASPVLLRLTLDDDQNIRISLLTKKNKNVIPKESQPRNERTLMAVTKRMC